MIPSVQDYENTLAAFTEAIGRLGENGLSTFLYGSMARGDIVPGHSDLDFWVFLRREAMEDESRFYQALDVMVESAKLLGESGLPVIHAFCYYAEDETKLLPASLVPNLQNDSSSRIVWGEDMRARLGTTAVSRVAYQAAYFVEMRQYIFHPLTPFMHKPELSVEECRMIVGALKYVKYLAEAACAALDLWPGELAAVPTLAQALPALDVSVIARVEAFRTGSEPDKDPEQVRAMLILSLRFVEDLHRALLSTSS